MTAPMTRTRPLSSPSMLEQRIQQHFIDSADLKYQSADALSKPIAAAVQAMLACVTSGGKGLARGNGGSPPPPAKFSSGWVSGFVSERGPRWGPPASAPTSPL